MNLFCFLPRQVSVSTAAGDRFDRSRGRSIESIDSIDSIIFRSLAKFLKNRSRRDDRFRQKIVKIRAILAIFRPFEDFGDFRFDRFDIFFDSIDTEPNDRWGPPCKNRDSREIAKCKGSILLRDQLLTLSCLRVRRK